jgi:hypothetical protein
MGLSILRIAEASNTALDLFGKRVYNRIPKPVEPARLNPQNPIKAEGIVHFDHNKKTIDWAGADADDL